MQRLLSSNHTSERELPMKQIVTRSLIAAALASSFAAHADDAMPAGAMPAAAPAAAEAKGPWTFSDNIGVYSDYRFRGISQTFKGPAFQGGFDLSHTSGFYVGTWGSNVSGNEYTGGNGLEWDIYGGYKFELVKDTTLDLGLLQYLYVGAKTPTPPSLLKYDTLEAYGALTYGPVTVKESYTTGNFFGAPNSKGSLYSDLTYTSALAEGVNLTAHVGHQQAKNVVQGSYTDYKLGVTMDAANVTWGATAITTNANKTVYSATSLSDGSVKMLGKGTLVLSVSKTI